MHESERTPRPRPAASLLGVRGGQAPGPRRASRPAPPREIAPGPRAESPRRRQSLAGEDRHATGRASVHGYHATVHDQRPTVAVQQCLDALKGHPGDASAAAIIRELLAGTAGRLRLLCASLLHKSYPRLARPPLGLQPDEMLSAVVERLMKALRETRPGTERQYFALADLHVRWELNDFARRLDSQPRAVELGEWIAAEDGPSAAVAPSARLRRILGAIDGLPDDERETFALVRLQGMTHVEAAGALGVTTKTVQRRLKRALLLLADGLADLRPPEATLQPSS